MHRKVFHFAYAMNFLFQVTITLLTPGALLVGGSWLLYRYCNVGKWIMVLGLVIGLICGLYSMICFLLKATIDPTEAQRKGATDRNDATGN